MKANDLEEPSECWRSSGTQLDYRTGGPPLASHLYTETLLREAFADLDLVKLREYEADLAGGRGHCGHSALIGLIAQRR